MPNLRDIKRRITSVEKTQQITRAMRMVSAAKLRRAEEAIRAARPYAERMRATLAEVSAAQSDVEHPLLEVREPRSIEVVVITSDRGLAGAFNGNAIKAAASLLRELPSGVEKTLLTPIGKKGAEYFRRHPSGDITGTHRISGWVGYADALEVANGFSRRFEAGEVDRVMLVYNEFVSTMTQRPTAMQLLPFSQDSESAQDAGEQAPLPYTIEPNPEALLAALVPKAVEVSVYRALLENQAGEHAARMTAMENATRNTEELIERLTLDYNRARQAAITKELVEIVTGAEAL